MRNSIVYLVFVVNVVLLSLNIILGKSLIFPSICILVTMPVIFATLVVLEKNWNRRIEIREGKLIEFGRNGKVRFEGSFADIAHLIPSQYKLENGDPNCFYIRFPGKKDIAFDPDIENMELLIQTLEQRTGKTFKR